MENAASEEIERRVANLLNHYDRQSCDIEEFLGAQFDAGLAWVHFPAGFGGMGLAPRLQRQIDEKLNLPRRLIAHLRNPIGLGMAAPTVLAHGSDEHKARHLRPTFTGAEPWCQLFSEPGAGSDLAGLSTRAVREGDSWVVTGQKVWTTQAHRAKRGLLLARTDPSQPKHLGLSYFLLDMASEGVTVRPLRQITNSAEFNEVFLDDVRIPHSDLLGTEGDGWTIARTTLSNERVALSGAGGGIANVGGRQIEKLLAAATPEDWQDPDLARRLSQLYIDGCLIRWTNLRARAARRNGVPGPEGSVTKLFQGLYNRRLQETFVDLLGQRAVGHGEDDRDAVDVLNGYLRAQANTIEGGTANIQRNVIGERVLGLPREPGPPRDLPWDKSLHN